MSSDSARGSADGVQAAARVLVADDSQALRTVVRITIESQGWTTLEATTGTEALVVARKEHPDLILLDLDFGDDGLDGLEVLAALRAEAVTAAIPTVILTASPDPNHEARANAMGAALFLSKPFGPIDLIAALRRVLGAQLPAAPLGLHLVQTGALTPGQLQRALEEQGRRDIPLGQLLIERRAISEPELEVALLAQRARNATDRLRKTVLIVDDHRAVRDGLSALVGGDRRFEVVGAVEDAAAAIALAGSMHPDLIVLDHEMPGRTGLDAVSDLRDAAPAAHIVMYTMSPQIGPHAAARGASAVVPKGDEARLLSTLRRLADTRPEAPSARAEATAPARVARIPRVALRLPRRELAGVLLAVGLYAAGYLILEPALDASAAAFSVVTVAVAGAILGPGVGVVAAILTALLTTALWSWTGHEPGEAILQVGGNGFGGLMLLVLGAGVGMLRVVATRARRVEALLGRALISQLDPAAVVDLAREIVDGQAAALFRVSADRSELRPISVTGIAALPETLPLDLVEGAARAIREMRPIVVDARPGLVAFGAGSAAFVPLRVGTASGGLLALFDRRAGRFGRIEPQVLEALGIAAGRALERTTDTPQPSRSPAAIG